MAEFIDIDQNDSLNIIPSNSSSLPNSPPSPLSVPYDGPENTENIYNIDLQNNEVIEPSEHPILVHESCDVSRFYGDANPDGSFVLKNLFSELVNEYQRSIARKNLGIADNQSLIWGAISGNLQSQTDLVNWVNALLTQNNNNLTERLNTLLNQWSLDINLILDTKAPIESPSFTGTPTSVHPNISDSSNQIATTKWVTSKINEGTHLTEFALSKLFMYIDEQNVSTTLTWDYDSTIEKQWLNDIEIPIGNRSYTITNINDSFSIKLTYEIAGKTYNKSLFFEKITPKLYGKSLVLESLEKTKESNLIVNCNENEYAYIYIPNTNESRLAVDNIVGGFNLVGATTIYNTTYYIYKTAHSGLGKLNITIL